MSDYDALTDLFLSEGGPAMKARAVSMLKLAGGRGDAGSSRSAVQRPVIEGLVLGHLPVLGAAWVGQYAKHVAERVGGPVGLLRVQGGQVSVDVVGIKPPTSQSRVGPMQTECATLEEGMEAAARVARHWLVRVDDTSEPDLLGVVGLDAVTLLTGADDAAVVSSYRTMKGMCAIAEGAGAQAFNLAIMGATEEKAAAAEAKLRRASVTFLGREIAAIAHVAKINAGATAAYFRGESGVSLGEVVAMALNAVAATAVHSMEPDRTSAESRTDETQYQAVVEPKARTAVETDIPDGEPPRARGDSSPRPARGATKVAIPDGLAQLEAVCPYAPMVRLAAGEDGSLHLIAGGGAACVRDLLTAAAWAGEHAALLAAACPQLSDEAIDDGPTLHVLTREAKDVRGLLDTAVKVHLLVEVDGAVVVRELN